MKSWSRRAPLLLLILLPLACDRTNPAPPVEPPPSAAAPFREAFQRLGFQADPDPQGCVQCHLGMFDPALAIAATEFRFVDAELQKRGEAAYPAEAERVRVIHALMAHPKLDLFAGPRSPHAGLDCAACHVTTDRSGELPPERVKAWEKYHMKRHPLLPEVALRLPPRTEAVCLRCHLGQDPLPGADLLNRGRLLYQRMACHTCHTTPGLKTRAKDLVEGERRVRKPGPPLTSLADKVDKAWANAWLYHPAHFKPTARMPAFFPRGEIGLPPQLAANIPPAQLERFERVV
ncbi:MAG TPA: hypothetical protein VI643_05485, partial [Planctomycetota bacterium]|nr:hypothetical protein [Planctomycetota bacterium]